MNFTFAIAFAGLTFGGPGERVSEPAGADRWFGRDKVLHFVVSAAVQGAGHSILRANGREYRDAAWGAAAVTATVGISKELWDRSRGRAFSWKDLAADAAGGGTAAVVTRQVDR